MKNRFFGNFYEKSGGSPQNFPESPEKDIPKWVKNM
jgi:hypothetical protein